MVRQNNVNNDNDQDDRRTVGRPRDLSYVNHPTHKYLELIRKFLSKQYKIPITDTFFAEILDSSESYLFTKIPSKIRTNNNPFISYETLLNWEFIIQNDKNIDTSGFIQFYGLTEKYIKIAKTISKHPNKYHLIDNNEKLLKNLRKAFSVGRKEFITSIELSRVLGFPESVLSKVIRSGYTRDAELMSEASLSGILYAIKRSTYEFLEENYALAAVFDYALSINHPMISFSPEYTLIEKLQYAFSDEYHLLHPTDYIRFYTFQQLSLELGLSHYWASDTVNNRHIPREGDTLMKIRFNINSKLTGMRRDSAINALNEYLSLNRYNQMNQERIANWLSSRYGDEYGDMYTNTYPITELGLLRLVDKVLNEYPSDFDSNRLKTYYDYMMHQMGMDAKTGDSICPNDYALSDVFLHHIFYWKGTSDKEHIVLVNRFTHPSINHPNKKGSLRSELSIESVKDMMILDRAKRAFNDFKPPKHWSEEAKIEYNLRLKLYRSLGYQIFLNINGYISKKNSG